MDLSRRKFLTSAALAASADGGTRPNVMVIVLDDLGCSDLGYLGAADLKTPNIDQLAQSGVRFRNWYSNAPVCAPARASILSGRYPARAGVPGNGPALSNQVPTLASLLKQSGYATGAFGKWHLGSTANSCPNAHGFDEFYGFHSGCVDYYSHRYYWGEPRTVNYHDLWRNRTEIFEDGEYLTERIAAESASFVRKQKDRPFFAYVAFNAPHYPMHAPARYRARFPGLEPERQTYAAMIAAVDDGIGAIRSALIATGAGSNTMIFLLGDNGATTEKRAGLDGNFATAGNNGVYRGFKFSLFDGGLHVPCLFSWPEKIRQGRWSDKIAMSMDILPTVASAAGIRQPEGIDGAGLLPLLLDDASSPHEAISWTQDGQAAIRKGRWKLVVNGRLFDRRPEGNKPLTGEDSVWLSDLEADPGETRNLRRVEPRVADELLTALNVSASQIR